MSSGWAEEIKEPERWEPAQGEDAFFLCNYGHSEIGFDEVSSCSIDALSKLHKFGLCTKTREELETTLLLLKLRQSNGGWKPRHGDEYFSGDEYFLYSFDDKEVTNSFHGRWHYDMLNILVGNCYRTREEAEKYAPEWKKLFDSIV